MIGFLSSGSPDAYVHLVAAFRRGLGEIGWIDGRNCRIVFRWADDQFERLPGLAMDLVRLRADVIAVPGSTPGAIATKAATSDIPIVFAVGTDPVKLGLVASMSHPGGNATGISFLTNALGGKRLELLKDLLPEITSVGLMVNPFNQSVAFDTNDVLTAGRTLGVSVQVLQASNEAEIDAGFAALKRNSTRALVISADSLFTSRRHQLVAAAARNGWRSCITSASCRTPGAWPATAPILPTRADWRAITRAVS